MVQKQHKLSEQSYEQIRIARDCGALVPIVPEMIEYKDWVVVICGDGERVRDKLENHIRHCPGMPHLISLNGTTLLVSPHSILPDSRIDGEVVTRHILKGLGLKGILGVKLIPHAPCLAGDQVNLNFFEMNRLVLEGKQYLKKRSGNPDLKVRIEYHIDFLGYRDNERERFRTYFVPPPTMTALLDSQGYPLRPLTAPITVS